jgi:hypothetical protein
LYHKTFSIRVRRAVDVCSALNPNEDLILVGMSFYASRVVFRELLTLPICVHEGPSFIAAKCSRHYATHRHTPTYAQPGLNTSSLLSQALDQKQRGARREDTVGPFQLGLSRPSFNEGTAKKWSELSPKGKGRSISLPNDELFMDFSN